MRRGYPHAHGLRPRRPRAASGTPAPNADARHCRSWIRSARSRRRNGSRTNIHFGLCQFTLFWPRSGSSTFSNPIGREQGFGLKPGGRPPSWGAEYTQDFTSCHRKCEIYEELRDFHSFRHSFVTCLRTRSRADPLTVAAIVGHTAPDPNLKEATQTDDYTHYSVAARNDAIGKLDYAAYGLDLGILVRPAAVCGPRGGCRVEDLRRAVNEAAG
jgi:integrase